MAILLKTIKKVTVAQAGVRQRLSDSHVLVSSATVQSFRTNTGYQYVGDSTVDANNGQEFAPGDVAEIDAPQGARGPEEFDLFDVFVDSTTNNAEFRITAWTRK
jgi:hypothetical protein